MMQASGGRSESKVWMVLRTMTWVVILLGHLTSTSEAARRPNILLAISDDHSFPHVGAYGDYGVKTPNIDRLAREGVLFTAGFCASPGCSPSRAALLTGRHTWQLENAGTHASSFPEKFVTYPDLLVNAGYHVGYTGKGWGPGNFKASGRKRNPAGTAYNRKSMKSPQKGISNRDYAGNFRDFLASKPKDAPFCFWYGCHEPHRKYLQGAGLKAGKQLADAKLPSFLPDTPECRSDVLDYYTEVEWFDTHLGRIMEELAQSGELENTLILVTGDNGMPFPRAKANCYEFGIHVPLVVHWGEKVKPGRVVNDLVGFVDIAPTFLEAAGLERSSAISGRSFLDVLLSEKSGTVDGSRTRAYSARERHSSSRHQNWTYPIRAMRTPEYLLIRNFRPSRWPAGHPAGFKGDSFGYYDIDAAPSKTFLWKNRNTTEVGPFFQLAVDKRPAVELFDIRKDPGNLHNLADDPKFVQVQKTARRGVGELSQKDRRPACPRRWRHL